VRYTKIVVMNDILGDWGRGIGDFVKLKRHSGRGMLLFAIYICGGKEERLISPWIKV